MRPPGLRGGQRRRHSSTEYMLLRTIRNSEFVTSASLSAANVEQAADPVAGRGGDHPYRQHLQAADPPIAHQGHGLVSADGEQHRGAKRYRHDGGGGDRDPEDGDEQERKQWD